MLIRTACYCLGVLFGAAWWGAAADLAPAAASPRPPTAQDTNSPPPAPRRPNIIMILADDLGYGDLGCYGQTRIKTPNLDRLAAQGMRFTDFYAGSTVCAPSRGVLMTGLHTGHAWIRGNGKLSLRATDVTVTELLKVSGYRTGLVGKWGLGNENTEGVPQRKGFEEFVGYLDQTHAHDYFTQTLWRYDFRTGFDGTIPLAQNQFGKQGAYTHDLFTKAALNFIKINKPDQFNQYRPFFLYLTYTIPHANNEEGRRSGNGMQVPSDSPYSDEPWPQIEKNKAAMITRLDADVGQLLGKLQELKLDQDTVIFFTSDNGPHKEGGVDPKFFKSSGPLRGIKRDLYEGGIRVPMIVHWPKRIKPGQVSRFVGGFQDFLPTAVEIAGGKPPAGIDGVSFLPLLMGRPQTNQHAFLYWEFHEGGSSQAVRMGDWKAVRAEPGASLELFNLISDQSETNNVAKDNPEVLQRIETYLEKARTESSQWPLKPRSKGKTNETAQSAQPIRNSN